MANLSFSEIVYSFPVVCNGGSYEIVQNLELSEYSRGKMSETEKELLEEKEAVSKI